MQNNFQTSLIESKKYQVFPCLLKVKFDKTQIVCRDRRCITLVITQIFNL